MRLLCRCPARRHRHPARRRRRRGHNHHDGNLRHETRGVRYVPLSLTSAPLITGCATLCHAAGFSSDDVCVLVSDGKMWQSPARFLLYFEAFPIANGMADTAEPCHAICALYSRQKSINQNTHERRPAHERVHDLSERSSKKRCFLYEVARVRLSVTEHMFLSKYTRISHTTDAWQWTVRLSQRAFSWSCASTPVNGLRPVAGTGSRCRTIRRVGFALFSP